MNIPIRKRLLVLLLLYGFASLIHFIHNAEFLKEYPNLPESWTAFGIYVAWFEITMLGVVGWILLIRGLPRVGLLLISVYAVLGMDSLGHYLLAPMSYHTLGMNSTILLEVTAAALVLIEVIRVIVLNIIKKHNLENEI